MRSEPTWPMRRAVVLIAFAGCVTTASYREAVDRVVMCSNALEEPMQGKAVCLPDVLAYCSRNNLVCPAEQLWQDARPALQLEAP